MFELGGLGLGLLGAIGKGIFGAHQNHLANQINPTYHPYQSSPYAADQLGIAQQLFNGRMAGAADEERNIGASQANYVNNAQRNATDSGQLLALGGLAQGQSNNAYNQLGIQEQQNKYNLLENLNKGYQTMIGEGNKVYEDQLNKYQMDVAQQNGLRNSGWQNIFGAVGDLSGGLLQYGQLNNGNNKTSPYANEDYSLAQIPNGNNNNNYSIYSQVPNTAMDRTSGSYYNVNMQPYGMVGPHR